VGSGGFRTDKNFGFEVPLYINGVDKTLLTPRDNWPNATAYDDQAQKLVKMFSHNFEIYKPSVDGTILAVAL
jgi:phosphoenolpyruvate carboxykinase (ATP)